MTTRELQRRTLLRGLLATGVALCLPPLAGCGRKPEGDQAPTTGETAPPTGQVIEPVPPGAAPAQGPSAGSEPPRPALLAQAAVAYQDHPKGDESCATCIHFVAADGTCKLVEGSISPQGWCTIWARKVG